MADSHQAQGSELYIYEQGSPSLAYLVGGIRTFDGPDGQATVIDTTDLSSSFKEKNMGLPDEGNITFGLKFISGDTGQLECIEARDARQRRQFRLTTPAGSQNASGNPAKARYFWGYVLKYSEAGGVDNIVDASITIAVDGAITRV